MKAVTDNAVRPTVRSLPASFSHRPRREKGRSIGDTPLSSPLFSSLYPALPLLPLPRSSGIILWLWSVELGVMWVKALSASTQRSKQSLIVGTR